MGALALTLFLIQCITKHAWQCVKVATTKQVSKQI